MSPWRRRRKPRIFWLILTSFAFVIVFGICGMITFFSLAFARAFPDERFDGWHDSAAGYAAALSDYYVANGESWQGVERRLAAAPFAGPMSFFGYQLIDADGRIVATNVRGPAPPMPPAAPMAPAAPIVVEGREVGRFVLRSNTMRDGPVDSIPPFFRSFLIAAGLLTLLLLALAAFIARRLVHPVLQVRAAAAALAAGQRDVRAPGAAVRELDELARAFNDMAESLVLADRQRRQQTADIAHELRTPLTIIKGRLEGIQDGVYAPTPEQIGQILTETALLERLIDDLRLLALADAGQLPLYPELVEPHELLRRSADAFADQAAQQQVALLVEADAALPAIEVDEQRMAQVLANLITNALRFTPAGGAIRLGAHAVGDQIAMSVADNGQGIDPADLPFVFERFWRADRARTRSGGGSGLGLAIARRIVEAHGGTITADSAPGTGTTITILMPLTQPGTPQ